MQTFLPYASFPASARILDYQRLGKQRVEAKQILLALTEPNYGWQSHPAVKMWRGYEIALATYGYIMCHEWQKRGYRDSLKPFFGEKMSHSLGERPAWLGNAAFHLSHQSNLVRKDQEFYRPIFPGVPADLPYVWPAA